MADNEQRVRFGGAGIRQFAYVPPPLTTDALNALVNDVNILINNMNVLGGTVQPIAGTAGGATPAHYLSAASTNATSVKASAGIVYSIIAINTTATLYYLKLYDKASAPTVGTDTPVQTYPVPASATGAGVVVPVLVGIGFTNGIAFALTGGIADTDATVAATGVAINLVYE